MAKYQGITFEKMCEYERDVLESALNRRRREYLEDDGVWVSSPCTKEESIEIGLAVYDEIVYQANEFLYASRALELVMRNHGLELGKDYTLQEYMRALDEVKQQDGQVPTIRIIK